MDFVVPDPGKNGHQTGQSPERKMDNVRPPHIGRCHIRQVLQYFLQWPLHAVTPHPTCGTTPMSAPEYTPAKVESKATSTKCGMIPKPKTVEGFEKST